MKKKLMSLLIVLMLCVICTVSITMAAVDVDETTGVSTYSQVAQNITTQGASEYIGEQGLDLTGALLAANGGGAITRTQIGWWASAAAITTTAPTTSTDLAGQYNNFQINPATFRGYTGNWYLLTNTGQAYVVGGLPVVVFNVKDPSLDIKIWDYDYSTDVTGSSVIQGERLGFGVVTNMYSALDARYRAPVYNSTGVNADNVGDGYMMIRVKDASAATYTSIISSNGAAHPLTYLNVSVQPYSWGREFGNNYNWDTAAKVSTTTYVYPTGTYTVWAESYLNNMKSNYQNGGSYYTGKTISEIRTITIVPDTVKITTNKGTVVRGNPFSVTITGKPDTYYNIWLNDTSTMSGAVDDQPPMVVPWQNGVSSDTPYPEILGDYPIGNYHRQNGGGAIGSNTTGTIRLDVSSDTGNVLGYDSTCYYAMIKISSAGTRTVEFRTTSETKAQKYTIRVERETNSASYFYGTASAGTFMSDEVDVKVEKGVVAPVANFTGTPPSGTAPLTVTFTDSSTNMPTSWIWSFGDGSSSTEKNPIHIYTSVGTYTVTLTATNSAGSNTNTKTSYITVTSGVVAPVASFTGTPISGTAPFPVTFTDSSTNTPTSWNWSFGDGSSSTEKNPIHIYTSVGTTSVGTINYSRAITTMTVNITSVYYTVALTATNSAGSNTSTQTNYITVYSFGGEPVANFVGTPTSGTAPLIVTFTDSSINTPTSWNWDFGDGNYSTEKNPSHIYSATGTYTVSLNATNAAGSNTKTVANYITVNAASDVDNVGVYRDGVFYRKDATDIVYGLSTDTPVIGDWNGDGLSEVGVYRGGVFYRNGADAIVYGLSTDIPVTGDWNGDNKTEVGIFRNGMFYLRGSTGGTYDYFNYGYGLMGDKPIAGDWNGDGTTEVGVFSNGWFYLRDRTTGGTYDYFTYGQAGDAPITGDWDRNGKTEIGVFRDGVFKLRDSTGGTYAQFYYGQAGDVPVSGKWTGSGTTPIPTPTPTVMPTPEPTQVLPDIWSIDIQVASNGEEINPQIVTTFRGGKGMNVIPLIEIQVTRADGTVETGKMTQPLFVGKEVSLKSTTTNNDRAEVWATTPQGDRVKIFDAYIPFRSYD